MKLSKLEELKDGWWCRLASGEVYTIQGGEGWQDKFGYVEQRHYTQALLDMGAEWYPPIREGYRLATEEDRKDHKPDRYAFSSGGAWIPARGTRHDMDTWDDDYEYIVPVKPEPNVYTVEMLQDRPINKWLRLGKDPVDSNGKPLKPGDRVRVEKVED